ncbi:MAG: DUF4292 domain-containing protein [Bacteroidota bacterium]|nr:DUF4292 domain-containing protein [Bacteroidota bacterium]MDP4194714.1 DUF4292 domain-containing protein [Bacteroidota bacterium]
MKKIVVVFLYSIVTLFPLFYVGCVPSKPSEETEIVPSDRLVKKLEANRRKVKNFEGVGSLNIHTPELTTNASFKVVLQKPDSVYLEVYGPFGIDLAQALVTDNTFTFYDEMHNKVYKGKSNSDILKKIFKVDLSFSDLMDAFTGAVNLTPKLTKQPDNYEIVYDKYVLTFIDPVNSQKNKYTIDIRDLVITDYQVLSSEDKMIFESVYSKFKLQDGISIPYTTNISIKNLDQNLKIDYRKIDLNKKNVSISLNIPDDAEIVEW